MLCEHISHGPCIYWIKLTNQPRALSPMTLELRQEHRRRAHWYGAESAILEKEANKLMAQAKLAKDRYFSELAKAGELAGAVYLQGSANA